MEYQESIEEKDQILPEDLRKTWNAKRTERKKLVKQWKKAQESIDFWVKRRTLLNYQLKRNEEELKNMKDLMIEDCKLTEEI